MVKINKNFLSKIDDQTKKLFEVTKNSDIVQSYKNVRGMRQAKNINDKVAGKIVKETKEVTLSTYTKGQLKREAKDVIDKEEMMKKAESVNQKLKLAGKITGGAILTAAGVDLVDEYAQKRRTEKMVAEQERNLKEKERRERQSLKQRGYSNINAGEIAFKMFDEAIGHHKIGGGNYR